MRLARLAVGFLFAALLLPAVAGMYKIVGPDGRVSYADTPPADAKSARVSEFKVKSYSGPAVAGSLAALPDWQAILRRPLAEQGARRGGVVMFSAAWCGYCQRAKRYMDAKGVAYDEIDIDKDARGKEEHQRLGARGVPFFVVGSKTLAGFSEAALDKLLRQ